MRDCICARCGYQWTTDQPFVACPICVSRPLYSGSKGMAMRQFETGATRDSDENKLDFEGFLSPIAVRRFAEYMHVHRKQADGALRDSDNWQKGIPVTAYMKSLIRHTFELWLTWRRDGVVDEELLCAIWFNVQGALYESLQRRGTRP